ncbi:MAG: hypothetical protein U9Q04_03685 [Campylobacterota bacterium]|nr:hypothetical protein [Campylobacterota bacterium]
MGLKKYIFGTIILIIAIFGYVFSLESGDYRVQIIDQAFVLPVAVWVILPAALLFTLTILHMFYYGLKNYFSNKSIVKDSESLISLIDKRLLKEKANVNFQNKTFKELNEIVSQLDLDMASGTIECDNKTINKTVSKLKDIKAGVYVPAKDLKLSSDNPLIIMNTINRINQDDNFALEVIKNSSQYSENVVRIAFEKSLANKSFTSIKKSIPDMKLDSSLVVKLLKKDSEQAVEIAFNNEEILNIIKKVDITNKELMSIARNYKSSMTPDRIIKLYEDITTIKDEYTAAYLYILAEYEMIDKMRDILVNSASDEFSAFKAFIDLRDAGKHSYSLDTICYR